MKRARQVPTVATQFMPLTTSRADPLPPKVAPPRSRAGLRSWVSTKAGGWGVIAAFAVFGVAIFATAYFAVQEIDETAGQSGFAPSVSTAPATNAHIAPAAEPVQTEALATSANHDDPTLVEIVAVPPGQAVTPPIPANPRQAPGTRKQKAAGTSPDSRLAGQSVDEGPQPDAGDKSGDAPAPAPVAIVEAPPAPSRWDAMNAALALCAQESFLAGVVCSERARLRYCEGHWGEVPQCRDAARPGSSR